ncbi:unnamed protein product [Absidia cylindrospora]
MSNLLLRSEIPINDIDFDCTGKKMAVATDEETIRLMMVSDVTTVVNLEAHRHPVKFVAYDPGSRYLVSSASDGTVIIWDINPSSGAPGVIKIMKDQVAPTSRGVIKSRNIAWNPSGSLVALIGRKGDIQLLERGKWSVRYTLKTPNNDECTTLKWSPNGHYLAVATKYHYIYIWDMEKREIINRLELPRQVMALTWHPAKSEVTYTVFESDDVMAWETAVPESLHHPIENWNRSSDNETSKVTNFLDDMALADDDSDDGEERAHPRRIDDVEQTDDGEALDEGLDENLFSDMESVQNGAAVGPPQPHVQQINGPVSSLEWPIRFQPGSTTFKRMTNETTPEETERRYLDFNLVGIVYTVYQSTNSIINVEFHDQSEHRNFHFSDYVHYSMAALGSNGLVFAVEGQEKPKEKPTRTGTGGIDDDDDDILSDDDDDNEESKVERTASMVHFRPLTSWSNQKEWTAYLPLGEDAEAVAINEASVIVTTSNGYVRLYTLSGVQTHIFCIQDIVSIVGKSDLALIVCSTGPTINKQQQNLEFIIVNTNNNDIIQRGPLPLSNESELTWIGFSETSQPATYDSRGILRVLHRQRRPGQTAWIPLFDGVQSATSRERTETYWPVGLLHDRLMCIILRGQSTEPYFPVPLATEVPLRIPTAATDSKCDDLEEIYLRKRIVSLHERDEADATDMAEHYAPELGQADVEMDKALLQLIQLACKSEKLTRALDLANALHISRSVDAAIQIASRHRLATLADKFTEIKELNFMNQQRSNNPHTVSLAGFQESQVSLFPSSGSTMSSDLAFVGRDDIGFSSHFGNSRKRPSTQNSSTLDADSSTFDSATMEIDTAMASPVPKRSR